MRILQYICKDCNKQFDEVVNSYLDEVRCPICGKPAARYYGGDVFTATGKPAKKCSGNCKTCGGCK